jgi:hypothetical protein
MLKAKQWNGLAIDKQDRLPLHRVDALKLHAANALDALNWYGEVLTLATDQQ